VGQSARTERAHRRALTNRSRCRRGCYRRGMGGDLDRGDVGGGCYRLDTGEPIRVTTAAAAHPHFGAPGESEGARDLRPVSGGSSNLLNSSSRDELFNGPRASRISPSASSPDPPRRAAQTALRFLQKRADRGRRQPPGTADKPTLVGDHSNVRPPRYRVRMQTEQRRQRRRERKRLERERARKEARKAQMCAAAELEFALPRLVAALFQAAERAPRQHPR